MVLPPVVLIDFARYTPPPGNLLARKTFFTQKTKNGFPKETVTWI